MIESTLPKRGTDDFGSGEFEAPRGTKDGKPKLHKGIDYACYPGTVIKSLVEGAVTKLGYPYSDDLSFRYVQVSDHHGNDHRVFYIEPKVNLHDYIEVGDVIGIAQDIAGRYNVIEKYKKPKIMKNHIHYEILRDGEPIDPELFHENL